MCMHTRSAIYNHATLWCTLCAAVVLGYHALCPWFDPTAPRFPTLCFLVDSYSGFKANLAQVAFYWMHTFTPYGVTSLLKLLASSQY
jgi:hypothetical protein